MSDANATANVGATKSHRSSSTTGTALRRTSDRPRSQALKQMDASESLAHRAYVAGISRTFQNRAVP